MRNETFSRWMAESRSNAKARERHVPLSRWRADLWFAIVVWIITVSLIVVMAYALVTLL